MEDQDIINAVIVIVAAILRLAYRITRPTSESLKAADDILNQEKVGHSGPCTPNDGWGA